MPSSNFEPLNVAIMEEVAIDNFIDILLIDVAIPDALWIDHHHRSFVTSIETASPIDADFPRAIFFQVLYFLFCVGLKF